MHKTLAHLLDLIIIDSTGLIMNSGVDEPIGDPYHGMVFCETSLSQSKDISYSRHVWHYKKAKKGI